MKSSSIFKKNKIAAITTVFLLLVLGGLIFNKLYNRHYNGRIMATNIKISNKAIAKNKKAGSIVEKINKEVKGSSAIAGNSTIEYDINYKLETEDKANLSGRTAIIDVNLSENDLNYANFNIITEKNISSKIINGGKTLEITVDDVTTNKEYQLTIKVNLRNAPNNYKLSPSVVVKEKTSEETKQSAPMLSVATNSITGTAIDSESQSELSFEPITLCRVEENGCVDEQITYTNESGNYSFSDLEIGTYEIGSGEDDENGGTQVETGDGNTNANVSVNANKLFNATINKYVKKVEIVEDGSGKTYDYDKAKKAALSVKKMENASLRVIYEFDISNNSKKAGYVKVVKEDIPEGMELDNSYDENKNWKESNGLLYNKTLANEKIKVGETKKLTIALKTKDTKLLSRYINNANINGEVYHTVNYIYHDETVYQEVVLDTELVTKQPLPQKDGYKVTGWYTDKEGKNKFNFNTPVTNDLNLYAIDKANSVDITLINKLKPYEYVENVEYGEPLKEPDRDNTVTGYKFQCWQVLTEENKTGVFNQENFDSSKCYDFSKAVTEKFTLIAVYTINSYKVRFLNQNSDGEYVDYSTENMTSPYETTYGSNLTVPTPEPTSDTGDFIGWFEKNEDGTFKNYSFNFSSKVDRNITLYSIFDDDYKYYKITYVVLDEETVVRIRANTKPEQPEDPEVVGYEFDGWYETDTFSTEKFDFNTEITKNTTLYAKMDESDKKVIFKEPYETPVTSDETDDENFEVTDEIDVPYGDTVDRPEDPKQKCKEFIGWFEKDEYGKFKSEPFSFDTKITKETTLYALYKTKDITVKFLDKNGEIIGEEQVIACGSKPVVPDTPDVPGEEFQCWEIYGEDACRNPGDPDNPDNPLTEDKTYKAHYEKIADLNIVHEPTAWTKENVMVTITKPDTKVIKQEKTVVSTLEDGTEVSTTTTEEQEVEFLNKEDYDIYYRIDNGEYNKYSDSFEVDKNSTIYARLKKKTTGEVGLDTEHLIDNIDKVAPRIDSTTATGVSDDRFTINVETTDLNDIEKVSGIGNIKFYLDDSEEPFFEQDFEGNKTQSASGTARGLVELTEYTVRVVVTDVAGNITDDDSFKVTTTEGKHKIVAQIISYNGVDLEPENYIKYYSLDSAINGKYAPNGTLIEGGCSSTYGPTCIIQMVDDSVENAVVPPDLDVTVDLNGHTITGSEFENSNVSVYNSALNSATIINNGSKFTIIDNNEEGKIGTIQNTNENGIGIFNTNLQTSILTIGVDEGKVDGQTSVVDDDKPIIAGARNGIYNSDNSVLNFYDGKVESTSGSLDSAPIYGEVTETPFKYNATILDTSSDPNVDSNTKIENLHILSDAVARIKSTYYGHLNGDYPITAIKAVKRTTKTEVTTPTLMSKSMNVGTYGFDYDSETDSLTSNNTYVADSIAESVISIDNTTLSNIDDSDNYLISISANISSEENNDIGCIVVNNSPTALNSCSNSVVSLSGDTENENYEIPVSKSELYYVHFIYIKNSSINLYDDIFKINSISILPVSYNNILNEVNPINITTDYGFRYDSNSRTIINTNSNINNSNAKAYIPIDTFDYTSTVSLSIGTYAVSETALDNGYIILSDSPDEIDFNPSESMRFVSNDNRKLLLLNSGNGNTKSATANLDPGKMYYLHLGFSKDEEDSVSNEIFRIFSLKLNSGKIDEKDFFTTKEISSRGTSSNVYTKTDIIKLNDVEPDTIHLLKKITLDEPLVIENNHNVNLDLNGFELTISTNNTVINNNGILNIIDEQYDGTNTLGKVTNSGNSSIINAQNAKLTVTTGNIVASNITDKSNAALVNNGELNYEENAIISGISANAINNNSTGMINDSKGQLSASGNNYAIYDKSINQEFLENLNIKDSAYGLVFENSSAKSLIVKNSTIENSSYGIKNVSKNITIEDSNISVQAQYGIQNESSGTMIVSGDSIIQSSDNISINNYGNFTILSGQVLSSTSNSIYNQTGGTFSIGADGESNIDEELIIDSGKSSFINEGNMNVYNGKMNSVEENVNKGNFTMIGGLITTNERALSSESGIINISGGIINYGKTDSYSTGLTFSNSTVTLFGDFKVFSDNGNATDIENSNSTINIRDNVIIGSNNSRTGVRNTAGTLNLGYNDSTVNTKYPKVYSTNIGVYNETATFNYYDGVITGASNVITNVIDDSPINYELNKTANAYNTSLNDVTLKIPDESDELAIIVTKTDDNSYEESSPYPTIQSAVNALDDAKEQTIKIIKTGNIDTILPIKVKNGKHFSLDLNGASLYIRKRSTYLTNAGNIKLLDSENTRNAMFYKYGPLFLVNNGTFEFNSSYLYGYLTSTGDLINNTSSLDIKTSTINSVLSTDGNVINNTGNFVLDSGTVSNSTGTVLLNSNSGSTIINGGRISSSSINSGNSNTKNSWAVYNTSLSTITINDGQISSYNFRTIYSDSGNVIINGGTVRDYQADTTSNIFAVYINGTSNFEMNGGNIYSSITELYLGSSGTNVMNDGLIAIGASSYHYENVIIGSSSTFEMNGGTLSGSNVVINRGTFNFNLGEITAGANAIKNSSNLNIAGGTITSNSGNAIENTSIMNADNMTLTSSGVGILNKNSGVLNISNSTITSTSTSEDSIGIESDSGTSTFTNSNITMANGIGISSNSTSGFNFISGIVESPFISLDNSGLFTMKDGELHGMVKSTNAGRDVIIEKGTVTGKIMLINGSTLTLGIKGDTIDDETGKAIPSKSNPLISGCIIDDERSSGTPSSIKFYDGKVVCKKTLARPGESAVQTKIGDTETGYVVETSSDEENYIAMLGILPVAEVTESNGTVVTENNLFYDDLNNAFSSSLCSTSCKITLLLEINKMSNTITINENQHIEFNLNGLNIDGVPGEDTVLFENNGIFNLITTVSDADKNKISTGKIVNNNEITLSGVKIPGEDSNPILYVEKIENNGKALIGNNVRIAKRDPNYANKIIGGVYNNGVMTIDNEEKGTILLVDNKNDLTVKAGSIEELKNESTLKVNGGNIDSLENRKTGSSNILGGKVSNLHNYGVTTIGKDDDEIGDSAPEIVNLTNERDKTVYYYDGVITGDIVGSISDVPENYSIEDNGGTKTLSTSKPLEVSGNEYLTFNDALEDSACSVDNDCTIKVLRDMYVIGDETTSQINEIQDITVDLNGHYVSSGIKNLFSNTGTFKIKSSNDSSKANIYSDDGIIVDNSNNFELEDATLSTRRGDTVVVNNKEFNNNGILKTASKGALINTSDQAIFNMNSGEILLDEISEKSFESSTLKNIGLQDDKISILNGNNALIYNFGKKLNLNSGNITKKVQNPLENNSVIYSSNGEINLNGTNVENFNNMQSITIKDISYTITSSFILNLDNTKLNFSSGTLYLHNSNHSINFNYGYNGYVTLNPAIGIQSTNGEVNITGGTLKINRGNITATGCRNYSYRSSVTGIKSISDVDISGGQFDLNGGTFSASTMHITNTISSELLNQSIHNANITGGTFVQSSQYPSNLTSLKADYNSEVKISNHVNIPFKISLGSGKVTVEDNSTIWNMWSTSGNLEVKDSTVTSDISNSNGAIVVNNSTVGAINSKGSSLNISNGSTVGQVTAANQVSISDSTLNSLSIGSDLETYVARTNITSRLLNNGHKNINLTDVNIGNNMEVVDSGGIDATNITAKDVTSTKSNNGTGKITIHSGNIENVTVAGDFDIESGTMGNLSTSESSNVNIGENIDSIGTVTHNSTGIANINSGSTKDVLNSNTGTINLLGNITVNSDGIGVQNTSTGIVNISDEAAINAATVGIQNDAEGTINLGTNDDTLSITNPSINGGTYGSVGNAGTINFYDGIITGKNGTSIQGLISYDNTKYQITKTTNADESESAILTEKGDVDSPIYANNQSYYDLQTAISSSPATSEANPVVITITKDITLTGNVVVPEGKYFALYKCGHEITYGDYTISGDGIINIYDGDPSDSSTSGGSGLGATIRSLLNIENPINVSRNIVVYNTDEGDLLESGYTYELQLLGNDGKYETVDVVEDVNNVGRYSVATTSSDTKMLPFNGRIYINNIPDGNYKVVSNNGKETTFTIEESGKLSGNAKINSTTNFTNNMSASSAEVIVNIQTGIAVFKVGLLMTLITIIIGLLSMIRRQARSYSE